jgi:two-component system, NarL family, nitrate/nitrite response regulator NarL
MIGSIRVAVVDDHPLFRAGVVNLLTGAGNLDVVGEGATASDALRIAQQYAPDVMLLDIGMTGGGIEAAAELAAAHPDIRVIMLTASEDEQHVASALKAGARGYILKGSSGHEIVEAVRAIAVGESYVAPNLAARLLSKKNAGIDAISDCGSRLTSREAEVFALVARGMSNKEIARAFKTTERTIKHHMTNIMQKLNVRNRVQAALKFSNRTE